MYPEAEKPLRVRVENAVKRNKEKLSNSRQINDLVDYTTKAIGMIVDKDDYVAAAAYFEQARYMALMIHQNRRKP